MKNENPNKTYYYYLANLKTTKHTIVKVTQRDIMNYIAQPEKIAILKAFDNNLIGSDKFVIMKADKI